ncbi:MAG: polymerase primary sigma factor [Solirubrobacterales bacterium]|nr:polymerase primary sigma factor [Solirubrobacterales bacterium]
MTAKTDAGGPASPLSRERERDLIAACEGGDRAATAELVEAFLPAINGVAHHYRGFASLESAELRQEGVVGLLRAAKHYDRNFETPFWAYASWWVRQAMQRLVAELSGPVVLSDRAARRLVQVKRARGEYQQAHGQEPSIRDLAAVTDLPCDQVENLIAIERPSRGLDERAPWGTDATIAERLEDPEAEDDYERVSELAEAGRMHELANGLDSRERDIVLAHFGIGSRALTLREIAGGLHLSVERVRQLEERALGKLRSAALAPTSTQRGDGLPIKERALSTNST